MRAIVYNGVKNVAPSTPEAIAMVAITMAAGNMNQNSKLMIVTPYLQCPYVGATSSIARLLCMICLILIYHQKCGA